MNRYHAGLVFIKMEFRSMPKYGNYECFALAWTTFYHIMADFIHVWYADQVLGARCIQNGNWPCVNLCFSICM